MRTSFERHIFDMLMEDESVNKSIESTLIWAEQLAAKEEEMSPHAKFVLAGYYMDGWRRINVNTDKALQLYKEAAEKGHAGACYKLANIYLSRGNYELAYSAASKVLNPEDKKWNDGCYNQKYYVEQVEGLLRVLEVIKKSEMNPTPKQLRPSDSAQINNGIFAPNSKIERDIGEVKPVAAQKPVTNEIEKIIKENPGIEEEFNKRVSEDDGLVPLLCAISIKIPRNPVSFNNSNNTIYERETIMRFGKNPITLQPIKNGELYENMFARDQIIRELKKIVKELKAKEQTTNSAGSLVFN